MFSIIIILLGFLGYIWTYSKTNNLLNPSGMMLLVWSVSVGLSSLQFAPALQNEWDIKTYMALLLATLSMFLGGYIALSSLSQKWIKTGECVIVFTKWYYLVSRILTIFAFSCLLVDWYTRGFYMPGLEGFDDFTQYGSALKDMKDSASEVSVKGAGYGILLIPIMAVISFFELLHTNKYKMYNCAIIFISVLSILLIQLSRGTLLIIFLGMLYVYNDCHRLNIKKLCSVFLAIAVVFVIVATIRISTDSVVFTSMAGQSEIYTYISPVYTYFAIGFENLDKLIGRDYEETYYIYTFQFLWHILDLNYDNYLLLYDTGAFNARTFLYPFYHDLKFIGVIVYPMFISFILSYIYVKSCKKEQYSILLACLQKAVFVTFFGNYFWGDFGYIWMYLVAFVIAWTLHVKSAKI